MSRYACPEIDRIWTEEAKLDRWLRVWRAASAATGHPLPPEVIEIDRTLTEAREEATGHDVQAALDVLRDQLTGETAEWAHFGLCSSDVVDAGWLLGIREASEQLDGLAGVTGERLWETCEHQAEQDTLYRTHGRAAQVKGAGSRWAGHALALQRSVTGVRVIPSQVGFNGPTGNRGALSQGERSNIVQTLGLRHAGDTGQQAADRTEWSGWLQRVASLATVCERIATEIRLLSIEEVGEVTEGRESGYVGSSSMPHKSRAGVSNPTQSERICGLAPVIRGLANGYTEAASSIWGAASLEHSSAERVCIPLVTSLTGYVLKQTAKVLNELEFDEDQVSANSGIARALANVTSYEDRAAKLR